MITLEKPTQIIPSATDRATAGQLAQAIRNAPTLREIGAELGDMPLPEYIRAILASVLDKASTENNFYLLEDNKEVSPNDAAKLLGCSRPFVRYLIEEGHLKARKIGSHYRIALGSIKTYLEEQERRHLFVDSLVQEREDMGL
jgi:excisionase family DNA binding protein